MHQKPMEYSVSFSKARVEKYSRAMVGITLKGGLPLHSLLMAVVLPTPGEPNTITEMSVYGAMS